MMPYGDGWNKKGGRLRTVFMTKTRFDGILVK